MLVWCATWLGVLCVGVGVVGESVEWCVQGVVWCGVLCTCLCCGCDVCMCCECGVQCMCWCGVQRGCVRCV